MREDDKRIYVTLDEIVNDVLEKEKQMKEPDEAMVQIGTLAVCVLERALKGDKTFKIFTDYDADGICSAYNLEKTLKALNNTLDVEVICNDRRNSYGLPKDIVKDDNSIYFVLDMGSNELDYIKETLGNDVFVIDHHLIDDEKSRMEFQSNQNFLNLHSLNNDDTQNAQYCTTGLTYRIFEEIKELVNALADIPAEIIERFSDVKLNNTLAVITGIGTATDVVNLMDMNSRNREFVKNAVELINNADETNLDFVLGHTLTLCGIDEYDIFSKTLAYNIGSFLNGAGRMSEVIEQNGADMTYKAITGNERKSDTYFQLERLVKINNERKGLLMSLQSEDFYKTMEKERTKDSGIFIYLVKENIPSSIAGLLSARLSEATDKACICLVYDEKKGYYAGSGRNSQNNHSLKNFLDKYVGDMDIDYGGHHDAVGISRIEEKDIAEFCTRIDNNALEIYNPEKKIVVLDITPAELEKPETFEKFKMLEPIGQGVYIPPIEISGAEVYANGRIKNNEHWKDVKFSKKNTGTSKYVAVKDWNYSSANYPVENGEIRLLAKPELHTYKGNCSIALNINVNREFDKERGLVVNKTNRNNTSKGTNQYDMSEQLV